MKTPADHIKTLETWMKRWMPSDVDLSEAMAWALPIVRDATATLADGPEAVLPSILSGMASAFKMAAKASAFPLITARGLRATLHALDHGESVTVAPNSPMHHTLDLAFDMTFDATKKCAEHSNLIREIAPECCEGCADPIIDGTPLHYIGESWAHPMSWWHLRCAQRLGLAVDRECMTRTELAAETETIERKGVVDLKEHGGVAPETKAAYAANQSEWQRRAGDRSFATKSRLDNRIEILEDWHEAEGTESTRTDVSEGHRERAAERVMVLLRVVTLLRGS